MPDKTDLKKTLDAYRARRDEIRVLDVPAQRYLMLDGHGDPNTSPAFSEAIRSLYPVAYRLKFASRRDLGRDYVVPPLEGLWSADDMASFTTARDKSRWSWTLMILIPEWIDSAAVDAAIAGAADTGPRAAEVRGERLDEGRCAQTLHVGSFDDEGPVLARMHDEVIPAHGMRMTGRHHEVYLSDFRRVPPERRRTILRQPVTPA
ncbi:GyrI-like domain-containing protein [Microbacterium marinilacus]|uniref:GyrI-like domain-containing protein n=1 Tax=Microbacterium marinilacus TaxID=415209 RepID=A0ABP7BF07_9MICO|nr:GyrI-like domain-containing protein [Microbacterium marinilacus]MBY0689015.1 GyrI-like domain-containing protein [Microbacterium marinilacus]